MKVSRSQTAGDFLVEPERGGIARSAWVRGVEEASAGAALGGEDVEGEHERIVN
jgi:hypothetical protein